MNVHSPITLRQRRKLTEQCLMHFAPRDNGVVLTIAFPHNLTTSICIITDKSALAATFALEQFQRKSRLLSGKHGVFSLWQDCEIVFAHRYGDSLPCPEDRARLTKRLAHWLSKNTLALTP